MRRLYEMSIGMPNKLDSYDVIVAGAGIGGLLSAAMLTKSGFSVIVFERLSFIGGRFTSFNFKGYEIPSGAVHMIPNSRGSFTKIMREFGIDYKKTDVWVEYIWGDRRRSCRHATSIFSALKSTSARWALAKVIFEVMKPQKTEGISFGEYLKSEIGNDELYRFFEAFANFSLSLSVEDISAKNMFKILKDMLLQGLLWDNRVVPIGGCKGVVRSLKEIISAHNGKIVTNADVRKILVHEGVANGVFVKVGGDCRELTSRYVVSNLGPIKTYEKMDKGGYSGVLSELRGKKPPAGITISIAASKDMLGHSGITLTPIGERVCGMVQPTAIDPSLAPEGKHLLLTHQILKSQNIKKEIELGIADLHNIFPDFDEHCEILCAHSFHSEWPVNYITQGEDLPNRTQIENLFMVGDGNKPPAHIMTEGVAHGVKQVVDAICASQSRQIK
ncbi:MAG: NAD(P)/FAD-dependent oxidoreductase [Euryarchaeota archaeon]|nr:NAD(P)/FAD-dependent oxidoreductase [Euryarchaeota archaeon]